MRLLSRIVFGGLYRYERTFDTDLSLTTRKILRLMVIKDLKVLVRQNDVNIIWKEMSKKFEFRGSLLEKDGNIELKGAFVLGTSNTIFSMCWFLLVTIPYALSCLGMIELARDKYGEGSLILIIIGLIMFIFFLLNANNKVKEITEMMDEL